MHRAAQFILALIAIVVLAPLFVLAAVLVRTSLGSPVLFIQTRSGRDGRPFPLIKMRSMHNIDDALGRPLPDIGRTPAIGRFIRRTRLDELPGLFNILRGDMAFVGPRPLLPATIESLGSIGRARGSVCPGLTGWAQVNGNAMLTLQQKVALDLWYIANRSFILDLEIIFRTVGVIFFGERINPNRLEDAVEGRNRRGC